MTQEVIGSIVRTVLTTVGASLVTQGYIDAEQLNTIAGGVVVAITLAWSIWQKIQAKKRIIKAAETGTVTK